MAKPRQAIHLGRGLRKMSVSRTGFVGNLSIRMCRSDGTGFEMRGEGTNLFHQNDCGCPA